MNTQNLTVKQAAAKLGLSISLLYSLLKLGRIRHTRHGRPGKRGTLRITPEALDEYSATCTGEFTPPAAAIPKAAKPKGGFKHLRVN